MKMTKLLGAACIAGAAMIATTASATTTIEIDAIVSGNYLPFSGPAFGNAVNFTNAIAKGIGTYSSNTPPTGITPLDKLTLTVGNITAQVAQPSYIQNGSSNYFANYGVAPTFGTVSGMFTLTAFVNSGIFNFSSGTVTQTVITNDAAATTSTGAVPEPATWAMMILGMGAVGYAMRRRKVTTRVQFA